MKLTEEQKTLLRQWADAGATLNQIQDRLKTELGVTLTFMDTRFLVSDLGLRLQAPRDEDDGAETPVAAAAETAFDDDIALDDGPPLADGETGGARVAVTVDDITIPNAMASGKVTFTDGTKASWYLDQFGSPGLSGVDRSYRPPEADCIAFQRELQGALRRAGF